MSEERPNFHRYHPHEVFGLTESERLFYRVNDTRFRAFLAAAATQIHTVSEDSNSYGEFLFVTVSRPDGNQRSYLTFYGLGLHEQREVWIMDHWYWYDGNPPLQAAVSQTMPKDTVQRLIQERRDRLTPFVSSDPPSARALLFSLLADLVDEDGALAELDDLNYLDTYFDDEE